jgi:hypothetical protein
VLLAANALPLDGIAVVGSASFLLIYAAVNIGHLRLCRQTGAKPLVIWASIAGCILAFGALVYYEVHDAPGSLVVLAGVVGLSFAAEWAYRRYTARSLRAADDV